MSYPLRWSGRVAVGFGVMAFALALGVAGPHALLTGSLPTAAAEVKEGDRAPEPKGGKDADGKDFTLASLRGGWVVMTFGGSWCKPCKKELPAWDRLAGKWAGKVTFVAININDQIDDGKRFNKKLRLSYMMLAYMPQEKSGVAPSYGSDHMPSTFVADPQGVVRFVHEGFEKNDVDNEYKKMKASLEKLLAK